MDMPESRLLTDIGTLLFVGAGIYWMGRHEHKRVSQDSRRKYIHGRYIPEWVAIGFVGPGLVAYALNWPKPATGMGPMILSCFGLLVGLAGGWIHGGIRLFFDRPESATSAIHIVDPLPDDGNPYRPPNSGEPSDATERRSRAF